MVNFVCVVACRVPVLFNPEVKTRVETRVAANRASRLHNYIIVLLAIATKLVVMMNFYTCRLVVKFLIVGCFA